MRLQLWAVRKTLLDETDVFVQALLPFQYDEKKTR